VADVVIYHNPRCSKSRETLALLQDHGVEPHVIEYLKAPPSVNRLRELVTLLGGDARSLLRTKEPAYAKTGLSPASSNEDILAALVEYPILLERPVVVKGRKAAIGRPPENVLKIL
jgi:arsenate reductase (glutaredoxin)